MKRRIVDLATKFVREFKKVRGRYVVDVEEEYGEREAAAINRRMNKAYASLSEELLKPGSPKRPFAIPVPKEKAVLIAKARTLTFASGTPPQVNFVCYDAI